MNITSNSIKFSGRAEIPEPLEIGKNYKVLADGQVTRSELHDNQDGSFSQIFTFKPVLTTIETELGTTIKAKDNRSYSQKLRSLIWSEWDKSDSKLSFDEYYEQEMRALISERLNNR